VIKTCEVVQQSKFKIITGFELIHQLGEFSILTSLSVQHCSSNVKERVKYHRKRN